MNNQSQQQVKEKKGSQQNQLNVPDIYEDQDMQSDNNSYDGSQKLKKRNKKKKKPQNSQNKNINARRDKYGTEIVKGGKRHKIQFAAKLQEVRVVENWKMYNCEDYETEGQKSSCCWII